MQSTAKTVIVTGAARGIGAGITKAFLDRGHNVVANSLHITQSEFAPASNLALVEGDVAEAATASKLEILSASPVAICSGISLSRSRP